MEAAPRIVPETQGTHAEVVGADQKAKGGANPKANWRDIEWILKWAAVAYGFGFLTVMWYTHHRLGVPVLQLIEPVNVWIGAPLAIVAFFLDKLLTAAKKVTADFVQDVKDARRIRDELSEATDDLLSLFDRAMDIMARSLALIVVPFGLLGPVQRGMRALFSRYLRLIRRVSKTDPIADLRSADRATSDKQRKRVLAWIGRILGWAGFVGATSRLVNRFGMICLVPLACVVYVHVIFPGIPQTLGGGRPISVELILPQESVPRGKEFGDWLPSAESAPQTAGHLTNRDARSSVLVPVTLYLRTEHDLYVQKGSGPIVSLSDHAIDGVLFPSAAAVASSSRLAETETEIRGESARGLTQSKHTSRPGHRSKPELDLTRTVRGSKMEGLHPGCWPLFLRCLSQ